jgi:hypothetical protein
MSSVDASGVSGGDRHDRADRNLTPSLPPFFLDGDNLRLDDLERTLSLPFFPSPTTMSPIMPIWLVLPNWTKPGSYRPFWAIGDPETADFGDDDVLAFAEVEYAP